MKRDLLVLTLCLAILLGAAELNKAARSKEETFAFAPALTDGVQFVLDAGHGGEDGGALSAAGDKESTINLSIVLRTEQLLGLCGVSTVLTRREDVSIHDADAETLREKKASDLRNRVALVAAQETPVLLSVHQNSYSDPRYFGAQVFYADTAGSQAWGEHVQELLRLSLDEGNDRAAKQIPDSVYLMNHISCPAILVECGFMSNREEAAKLLTADYQKKLAAVLTGACLQYLSSSDTDSYT